MPAAFHKHKSKNRNIKHTLINSCLLISSICIVIILVIYYQNVSGFIVMYNIEKSKDIKYPLSISKSFNKFLEIKNLLSKQNIKNEKQNLIFNKNILTIVNRGLTEIEENISTCIQELNNLNIKIENKDKLAYMLYKIYNPKIHVLEADNIHKKFKKIINQNNKKQLENIEILIYELQKQKHVEFYFASIAILSDQINIKNEDLNMIISDLKSKDHISNLDCNKIITLFYQNINKQYQNKYINKLIKIDIVSRLLWAIEANSKIVNYSFYTIKNDIIFYFDNLYEIL